MLEKEKIFSKLNIKDYNIQLEEILEAKKFEAEAENLLLNMFYKIEASYKDYKKVTNKNIIENKFIQELLQIIENKCDRISLISLDGANLKKQYYIDYINKSIKVFPNEVVLIYALYKLGFGKKTESKEFFSKIVEKGLKNGKVISASEIIRDFNGWTWEIGINQIENYENNIIYYNILFLLGEQFIKENIDNKFISEELEKQLTLKYGNENAEKLLKCLYQVLAGLYSNNSSIAKKRVIREIEKLEKELFNLNNKEKYVQNIKNKNIRYQKNVKNIEKILNNVNLIRKEFYDRNKNSEKDNAFFSISDLANEIEKEKLEFEKLVNKNNELLKEENYKKLVNQYKTKIKLLKNLKIDINKKTNIDKPILELQKEFLKTLLIKIEKANTKKELINLIYEYRYYNFLPYKKGIKIRFDSRLENQVKNVSNKLIDKCIEKKVIENISSNDEINKKILSFIFISKIMTLENLWIKTNKLIDGIEIEYFDVNTLEEKVKIDFEFNMDLKLKMGKKIRVFT